MWTTLYQQLHGVILLLLIVSRARSTPNIGIQQDWISGDEGPDDLISFSGIIEFNQNDDGTNPVDTLSDGKLVGLASKAFDEMNALPQRNKPNTIAVMATKNQIYFASSMTGEDRGNWLSSKHYEHGRANILIEAAGGCRLGGIHRKGGRCGEINLFDLFYNQNKHLNLRGSHSRILAWGSFEGAPAKVYHPCRDDDPRYGCESFLKAATNDDQKKKLDDANLKVVNKHTRIDQSWPEGLQFRYRSLRLPASDFDAACRDLEDPFDPNHPELRRRTALLSGKLG